MQGGEYGRVCKVEDSHRDKTDQCEKYICSSECLCCTEFFVELGANGKIEAEVGCGELYVFFSMRRAANFCMDCDEGFGQRKRAD